MLHFTDMLLQQRSLLQKAEMRVKVPSPPRMCLRHTVVCHTPLQTLQQSINQALEAQRLESEQQLAFTAEFIAPKWPQLRAEITKVRSWARESLQLFPTAAPAAARPSRCECQVLSSQLSPEEKKLQRQRLQQLRKHIKDAELDLFLAGCARRPPRPAVHHVPPSRRAGVRRGAQGCGKRAAAAAARGARLVGC